MHALKALLLVGVAAVHVSGQASELQTNRCLTLLSQTVDNARYQAAVSRCFKTAQNVADSIKDKLQLKLLVARCIGSDLQFVSPDGRTINKAYLKSLIQQVPSLTQQQKDTFSGAVDRCNNFDSCLTRECDLI